MAFECKDNIGYSSPNNCNSSSWDKEPVLVNPKTQLYNLCATTTANSSRKHHSKSIISQPVSALPSEQVDSKSNSNTTADDSARNGNKRSFNDLPPALVCEILQCLDAKELGIVSCVSTLLNSLASDHHGWKNFYCERWGMPPLLCSKSVPVSGTSVEKSWKDMFVEREFRSRSFMGSTADPSVEFRLWGHEGPVTCLALDSARIYSGSWDMSIRVWDRSRRKCLRTLKHGDWYPWLVSAGGDGRIALIDVRKLLIPSQKSSLSKFSGVSRVKQSALGAVEPPQRMLS
ncbi:F-box/WD-40 repeat-containing protein, partial [Ananas comosus]